jgi:hypothetical protein
MAGTKPAPTPVPKEETLEKMVDRAGLLWEEVKELEDKKEMLSILKAAIEARCKLKPDQDGLYEGTRFAVVVGTKTNEREITDMAKVYEFLGKTLFLQNCSFTLGKLDALLRPDEVEKVVKQEQTGARRLKFVRHRA